MRRGKKTTGSEHENRLDLHAEEAVGRDVPQNA
jgi:hypothetical protein